MYHNFEFLIFYNFHFFCIVYRFVYIALHYTEDVTQNSEHLLTMTCNVHMSKVTPPTLKVKSSVAYLEPRPLCLKTFCNSRVRDGEVIP